MQTIKGISIGQTPTNIHAQGDIVSTLTDKIEFYNTKPVQGRAQTPSKETLPVFRNQSGQFHTRKWTKLLNADTDTRNTLSRSGTGNRESTIKVDHILKIQSRQQQYFGMRNDSAKEATDIDEVNSGTNQIEN